MTTLKRLLLAVSLCCLIATANAAPLDDAKAANDRDGYAQTVKILRPLAEQGYAAAQTNLGFMYAEGQGVTQDHQEALKWYRLAAAQGFAGAQSNIGRVYLRGFGVTQDYQEALKWIMLAADSNFIPALEAGVLGEAVDLCLPVRDVVFKDLGIGRPYENLRSIPIYCNLINFSFTGIFW